MFTLLLPTFCTVGDSRAVLSRGGRAVQVTDDHKPEREDEAVSCFAGMRLTPTRVVDVPIVQQTGYAPASAPGHSMMCQHGSRASWQEMA